MITGKTSRDIAPKDEYSDRDFRAKFPKMTNESFDSASVEKLSYGIANIPSIIVCMKASLQQGCTTGTLLSVTYNVFVEEVKRDVGQKCLLHHHGICT